MAFGDLVGTPTSIVTAGGDGDEVVTFSAATAGNLLILLCCRQSANTTYTDPSEGGWTAITDHSSAVGDFNSKWWYKIASGGETSASISFNTSSQKRSVVLEFEGPFDGTPLHTSAENEADVTGTQPDTVSGDAVVSGAPSDILILFFIGADTANLVFAGASVNNSFSFTGGFAMENDSSPGVACAKRVTSGNATYNSTFTHSDTGGPLYGAIAVFEKSAGGATTRLTRSFPLGINLGASRRVTSV